MSIELLPFSAFALESCAAPAPATGEGQTLTVAQSFAALLSLGQAQAALPGGEHACVVPCVDEPLTLTF